MTCVVAATFVAGLVPAAAEAATTGQAPAGAEEATPASSRPAAPMPAPPPAPVTPKEGFVPGRSTEDVSKRTPESKTFRNPDGSQTAQISGDVQHYWTGSRWADISNRLVADPAGGYRNQANSFTARFRSSEVRVETPQGTITLNPAGVTLGTPVVDSAAETVTYPDVWPGVDVRYQVHGTGVKEELVLRRRPSMSQFPFQVQGTSLTPQPDGSLETSGAFAGKWEVSPPVVFAKDGSTVPAAAPRFSVAGATVTLAVDGSWLSGLDDAAFPVVLDPSLHSVGAQTSRSYERNPFDNGYSTCEQPCQVMVGIRDWANGWRPWRSVQYFPYENLYGKQIINGQLIYQSLQEGTTAPKAMHVYGDDVYGQWGGIWNWSNLGAHLGSGTASGDSFIFDGANGGPLAGYYQDLVNRRLPFIALKFLGDETSGNYTFKRFAWFQLQLTYNDPPAGPYYIAPPANATLNYPDPWLVANNNDPNGDNVALRFRLYREADGAYMGGKNGGFTCNGCQDSWYAGPLANGRYFWDEWAWDGWLDSPIVRNYFTIAVTVPPGAPQNVVAAGVSDGSATVTWTPPGSTGGSPIDQYAVNVFYASNGAWTGQQVVVCGTCTSASVTGLALNTGYYFGAYAHNSAGYGTPGISNTITIPNVEPVGVVEHGGGSRITGWVHDPNNSTQALTVRIYLDGASTPTATVTANVSRPNANPPATDGFNWVVPEGFRDGKNHAIKVEALDSTTGAPTRITDATLSFAQLRETWTGATTSPWDTTKWITSVGVGGGVSSVVDVNSNQGRLFVKGGDAMAIAQNATGTIATMRDADALFTYRFDSRTASSTFRSILRGSGTWPLASGYRLNVTSDDPTIRLERVNAGSATTLGSFTYTKTTTAQRVRFRVEGARVRVKVWLATNSEPDGWQIDVTDASPLPGSGVFQLHHSVTKGSRSVLVDDLVVTRLTTAANEPNPSSAPPNSVSMYLNFTNAPAGTEANLSGQGAEEGNRVKANGYEPFVILMYGAQLASLDGATGYQGNDYSGQELVDSAASFAEGYYGTNPGRELTLALGTNNSGFAREEPDGGESDAKRRGGAWAGFVNQIYDRVHAAHPNMEVLGAQDFEQGDDFGGPAPAGPKNGKAWVAGFDSAANGKRYLNFGSADGCPTTGANNVPKRCETGAPENHTGTKAWTQEDYVQLTQRVASARGGVPQIYNTPANSQQWQQISSYGFQSAAPDVATSIDFLGALTQVGACTSPGRSCMPSVKTPPADAWADFKAKLDADERTKGPLGYSTDITWEEGQ